MEKEEFITNYKDITKYYDTNGKVLPKYQDFLDKLTDEILETFYYELIKVFKHLSGKVNERLTDDFFNNWESSTAGFNGAAITAFSKNGLCDEFIELSKLDWYNYDFFMEDIETLLHNWFMKNIYTKKHSREELENSLFNWYESLKKDLDEQYRNTQIELDRLFEAVEEDE